MSHTKMLRMISTILCASLILCVIVLPSSGLNDTPTAPLTPCLSIAPEEGSLSLDCKSAILMDATTGVVLYEQNADQALPPASVTKIMTLLLVMEAIDQGKLQLTDLITVSENAAGMGGSQVFLEQGETMSCEDLLKSVVISSANDAAVALAEHIAGDIDTFVRRMNEKAASLGMKNTLFENATGLDDTAQNHLTSARDIAIMSRALIQHSTILKYSSLWMDTIRNGAFGLTNTNRLVRFYRGATGLKTGSTDKAGFCISATAQRDGLSLICVIMGAETRDIRNNNAMRLLDWGFANYAAYRAPAPNLKGIRVTGGEFDRCDVNVAEFNCVLPKGEAASVEYKIELPESMAAPVKQGDVVGQIIYQLNGQEIGRTDILANCDIPEVSFSTLYRRLLSGILLR